MFIDEVNINVKAGYGGDGCTAFRREKYVPDGGPAGGNGGKGGDIIFKVDLGLRTLIDFRFNKKITADKGTNGSGKNKTGKNAEDVIIKVPQGTTIYDNDTSLVLADLTKPGDFFIVAKGGRGGRGNSAFATSTNPAPNFSEKGEPGEERNLRLELRLLADVGFVGFPSVGKSTLLSKISSAKPKIADYHFTTLSPNLGLVKTKDKRSFVAADLPGLIEGASTGAGLGDKFLKHIERTKIIAHIIDMSGIENRDPYNDYITINKELKEYSKILSEKPQIIIANKMDIETSKENLLKFKEKVNQEIIEIEALNGKNLDSLILKLADKIDDTNTQPIFNEECFESHVLYKFSKEKPFNISKINEDTYEITGDKITKLFKMTKFNDREGILRFAKKLRSYGIDEELQKMGAKYGDNVKILDYIFEYKE